MAKRGDFIVLMRSQNKASLAFDIRIGHYEKDVRENFLIRRYVELKFLYSEECGVFLILIWSMSRGW